MDARQLGALLRDWTAGGIISPQQAEDIRIHELSRMSAAQQVPAVQTAAPASVSLDLQSAAQVLAKPADSSFRIPVIGEAFGYVGATLSLAALFALVAPLGPGGQIATAALVTAALLGGGAMMSRIAAPAGARLANFLLFLGVASAGLLTGLVTSNSIGSTETYTVYLLPAIVGSLTSFVVGGVTWWFRKSSLQLTATLLGLWSLTGTWLAFLRDEGPFATPYGMILILIGVVMTASAEFELVRPRTTAWALGCISLIAGLQTLAIGAGSNAGVIYLLASLVGGVLIAVAMWRKHGAPLAFGAAAIVLFVPELLYSWFEDSVGAPLILLFSGVLLVAMAVFVIVLRPRVRELTVG